MPIPLRNCWFENLAGQQEWFDFEPLQSTDVYPGRVAPHHNKVLCAIPSGRWVLMFVDGLGNMEDEPGSLVDFSDIEVTPDFVVRWLDDNNHPRRNELGVGLGGPSQNPYRDPRVNRFYEDCETRSRSLASRLEAETGTALVPAPVQEHMAICIDFDKNLVYVDGEPYVLKKESDAVCLEALVKNMGQWVSVTKLIESDVRLSGENPSRLLNRLRAIPGLKDRIKSEQGKGVRIV